MKNLAPTTDSPSELPDTDQNEKERQWEENHARISNMIMEHIGQHGSMPPKVMIATATGLSRETVYRHIRTFSENPIRRLDSLSIMAEPVLNQVLKTALQGNLNAAKIFLDIVKTLSPPAGIEKGTKQNNYIQINETIINQQIIQQLKPEQLHRLELMITQELENDSLKHG